MVKGGRVSRPPGIRSPGLPLGSPSGTEAGVGKGAAGARFSVLCVLMLLGWAAVLAGPALGAQEQVWAPPGGCDTPPRSFEEVSRLIQIGKVPERAPIVPSEGGSARPASAEEIRAVLMQFIACSGTGEPLRVWSLYTDGYLARLLSRERGYDRVRYELDAEPHPIADSEWPVLTALDGIDLESAGRIAADATIRYPNLERSKQLRFWFAWQDGQLRIDEVDGEITFAVP